LLQALMPESGPGRWCRWGDAPGDDLPPLFSNCGGGEPGPAHAALFQATRAAFTRTCSGFATHQDAAFVAAVGVDYGRTLTLTALRHPVERVISGYYYSLKMGAPFLEGYRPANDTDFSGLLRFVADNPIDSNNLMTAHLAGARHCAWPGTAAPPPPEQRLPAAMRALARVCVVVLAVRRCCPAFHGPSLFGGSCCHHAVAAPHGPLLQAWGAHTCATFAALPGLSPPTYSWPARMPLSFLSTRFIRQKKVASISQQEFMEESLVQLAEAAGWPSADVLRRAAELQAAAETGRLNATPKPRVPPEVRRAIAAANLQDMALYEYAVQLFLRRSLPP
jgi:hypothetical protein